MSQRLKTFQYNRIMNVSASEDAQKTQ